MKLRLPHQLILTLMASLACYAPAQTFAQSSNSAYWSDESIDAFVTDMSSQPTEKISSWSILADRSVFTVKAGSIMIKADGTREIVASDFYVTQGGVKCDPDGTLHYVSAPTEEDPTATRKDTVDYTIILKDPDSTAPASYPVDTVILGSYPNDSAILGNGLYAAGSYSASSTATSSVVHINAMPASSSGPYLELAGGKFGQNYGSAEAPAETKIFFTSQDNRYSSAQTIYGGNVSTNSWLDAPTVNANFVGDSYIAVKGGEIYQYGRLIPTVTVDSVVGGNYAYINGDVDKKYQANFDGDSHIAIMQGVQAELVVGGNYIDHDEIWPHNPTDVEAHFRGDVYIKAEADSWVIKLDSSPEQEFSGIVGGNFGNSANSNVGTAADPINVRIDVMAGDSGNELSRDASVASVTGASYITNKHDHTFYGNTELNIYSMNINGSRDTTIQHIDGIKGGFNSYSNKFGYNAVGSYTSDMSLEGTLATLKGNTNVTIDFNNNAEIGYSGNADFSASVIGASFATHGLDVTHDGNSTLNLKNLKDTAGNNVKFLSYVVGGNVNGDSDMVNTDYETNTTTLEYSSADQSEMRIGKVTVNVDSGQFYEDNIEDLGSVNNNEGLFVVGSLTLGGGSVHTNSTDANINGGDFNVLIGGNAANAAYRPRILNSLPGEIYPYDSSDATVGRISMGKDDKGVSVDLDITNGKTSTIVGGSYISDKVSHVIKNGSPEAGQTGAVIDNNALVIEGLIDVNITGGQHTNIIGGSYIGANISNGMVSPGETSANLYTATQDDVKLSIGGSTQIGDISNTTPNIIAAAGMHSVSTSADVSYAGIYYFFGPDEAGLAQEGPIQSTGFAYAMGESFIGTLMPALEAGDLSTLTPEQIFTAPPSFVAPDGGGEPTPASSPLTFTTESTTVELGSSVAFNSATIVSGGYYNAPSSSGEYRFDAEGIGTVTLSEYIQFIKNFVEESRGSGDFEAMNPPAFLTADAVIGWLDSWDNAYKDAMDTLGGGTELSMDNITIIGNRLLSLNDGVYENLSQASFVDFDEISIDADSIVDFTSNNQDLDALDGRNILDGRNASTPHLSTEGVHMTGTNTLRKTGAGTLKLNTINGQMGTDDNLQLVIESGKVVLAANSAATDQTNFKTLIVQTGTTLDMSAGSNTLGTAAGINGNLVLQEGSTLIADASRSTAGSGTSMIAGQLSVDGKFMLSVTNTDNVLGFDTIAFTINEGSTLNLGMFRILLFSNLTYTEPNVVGIDFLEGMWGDNAAKIALASDYMDSNFYLGDEDGVWEGHDVFIVWLDNGDFLLTSGSAFFIPEPSTATLSLLALAGLLARRRRKQA